MPVSAPLLKAYVIPFVLIFTMAACVCGRTAAENAPADSILELQGKTVQASRLKKSPDMLPQKIEIIDQRDISLTASDDLTDQLKKSSSIDVVQYPGLLSGVGMRGFRPQLGSLNQRTLLLIDGRPAGVTNYSTLDLIPVDRVEILKGPYSALYGPQAMSGVINVVPRRSTGKIRNEVRAGTGSFGRLQGTFISGGSLTEKLNYDLAARSFAQTRNYRIGREHTLKDLGFVEDDRPTILPIGAPEEKKNDLGDGKNRPFTEYEEQIANLRLGYDCDENWRLETHINVYDAPNAESPGDIYYGLTQPGRKSLENYNGDASVRGLVGIHDLELRAYAAREVSQTFDVANDFENYESTFDFSGVMLRDNVAWKSYSLTAGADFQNKSTESRVWKSATVRNPPYGPDYRISNASAYAQAHLGFLDEHLMGTVGTRYDRIIYDVLKTDLLASSHAGSESYDVFSSSAGLLYRFGNGLRLRGSAGQGFVTPDAYQVAGYSTAFPGTGRVAITSGNPDLKPERNLTFEAGAGFERPRQGISADLTYFQTEVEDRIAARTVSGAVLPFAMLDGDTVASRTTFVNANASHMRGMELRLSLDAGVLLKWNRSLRVFANSTRILEAEDETVTHSRDGLRDSLESTTDIKNVGKVNTTFGIEYDDRSFLAARFSGRYLGERKDTEFSDPRYPDIRYPEFLIFDATAVFQVRIGTAITMAAANFLDQNYYEKRGFNLPGRNYRLDVSQKF
jgi:outer membrane receptor protein involved in Fe transport